MKIEQILVQYLLKNKTLTLQGIGTFQLDTALPDTTDSDKPIVIPESAISFHYDPKANEDDDLVNFIVEHTNKIKPLAASDLESFLSLGRQFLNIGNPFTLHNLGTLNKINSGELVFKGGELIAEKGEPQKIKKEEEQATGQDEVLFNDYQQEPKNNKGAKIFYIFLIFIALGFVGWTVWHYGFGKEDNAESISSTEGIIPIADSNRTKKDTTIATSNAATVSLQKIQQNPADSFGFKIVVGEYKTKGTAIARLSELKSYRRNVIMYTNDSLTYRIAEAFKLPLSDTTKILDSLSRYYTRIYLEKRR